MRTTRAIAGMLVLLALGGCSLLPRTVPTLSVPPPDRDRSGVIERTLTLVDSRYLAPERVDPRAMLQGALRAAIADGGELTANGDRLRLETPDGRRVRIEAARVETIEDLAANLNAVASWIVEGPGAETHDDVAVTLAGGAVGTLDRWSKVVAGDAGRLLRDRFRGVMGGVGCRVGRRMGKVRVLEVWPSTPAAAADLRVGDVIDTIDGEATEPLSVQDVVRRMRGPEGTTVTIGLRRDTTALDVPIVRARIRVPTVASSQLASDIGYVRLVRLAQNTATVATQAIGGIREAPHLKGVIVDLRGNTGGSMLAAAAIADAFVDEGVLLETRGRGGIAVPGLTARVDATPGPPGHDEAVVVLVDGRTGSSAEILAAMLARRDRALIVGSRTFGKTLVQKLYDVGAKATLKLTVGEMFAAGEPVPSDGLAPDVQIEQVERGARLTLDDCPGANSVVADDGGDPVLRAAVAIVERWAAPERARMIAAARNDVCDAHGDGS